MRGRKDFRNRREGQQAGILRRIAAGESVSAACARADMPSQASVYRWAQKSSAFADALAEAQRRGAWLRWLAFDEAKARAFLLRLAAGERLCDLLRDPAMPRRATLRHWRATQGEFGGEVLRLIGVHRAERRRAMGERRRAWDEATADRVLRLVGRGHSYRRLRRLDPSLPGAWVIERWRRERPDFAFDLKANSLAGRRALAPRRMAAVLDPLRDRIVQGGSLASLGGRHGLPSSATLYRWAARSPDFARQVARACDHREDWYADQMEIIADDVERLGVAEARRRMAPLSRRIGQLKTRPGKRWLG